MRTRSFILVVVALLAALVGGALYVAFSGGDDSRRVGALNAAYTSSKTALLASGQQLGFLKSSTCGSVEAEAARQSIESKFPDPKQIGKAQYAPCQFTFAWAMHPSLYAWISDAMEGKSSPKDLTIQNLTYDYKESSVLVLSQAVITEFSLPSLDAASNEAAYMTMTVQPQSVLAKAGSGAATTATGTSSTKAWLRSGFKLDVGTSAVNGLVKLSGFGFDLPVGMQRPLFRELTVAVGESDPAPFEKMLQSFVLDGANSSSFEKSGKLTLMNAGLTTLGTLTLNGIGMSAGDLSGTLENPGDNAAMRRRYTLYVEGASFTPAP